MNSKYKVLKFKSNKFEEIDDLISIEEPLEISIKFKDQDKWVNQILSINNSLSKNILDSNNKLKFAISEIELLLNIKSSHPKYICDNCNAGFDKKIDFTKHSKVCSSFDK